ncbi:MAG: glycosyltransferase family 39 protein, partial [Bacteroidota bacterium]
WRESACVSTRGNNSVMVEEEKARGTLSALLHPNLAFIVVVALVVRIGAVIPIHAAGYMSDERQYISMAHRLLDGAGFVSDNGERSTIAPLYIGALAVVFKVFGGSLAFPHVLGCLMGVGIVLLGYSLCAQMFDNQRVALVAAGTMAFFPSLVIYSGLLVTETMYTLFMLGAFVAAFRMTDKIGVGTGILLGVASALAALTRAVFLGFFPVLVFIIWWMRRQQGRKGVKHLAVAVVAWALVLLPWTLRNYAVHGSFVPVSTGGGKVLLTGNNPFAPRTWHAKGFEEWVKEKAVERGIKDLSALPETQLHSLYKGIALNFITSHPFDAMRLALQKAHIFWVYPVAHSDSAIGEQA